MEFKYLCTECPIYKICELPCRFMEVSNCDTYDFAVQKIKSASAQDRYDFYKRMASI